MNRAWALVSVAVLATFWWFLSHSLVLVTVILVGGVLGAWANKKPWQEFSSNHMTSSLWGAVVVLYIRIEWGLRMP